MFTTSPTPATVTISCNDPLPAVPTVTATDDCDGPVTPVLSTSNTPGICLQEYTLTRTWTVTDAANNSTSTTQIITVEDNAAPTMNGLPTMANVTLECSDPLPAIPTVTATDICDNSVVPVLTTNSVPGTCPQEYTLTRTWTATDDCGNATSFVQTITVTDNTAPDFDQSPLPAGTTAYCGDMLPMPEALTGTDNCDPGAPPPVIFINEIHYDNTGGDTGEFIEIAGTAGIDLSNYQLVLYNGNDQMSYNTLVLSGVIDNESSSGFGAVSFSYPVDGIQNGAPDGIALATTSGTLIQFLSYEGTFTANNGVAMGVLSTDIGVDEDPAPAIGQSIKLTGTGQEYADFTWTAPSAASPGTLNAGQTITPLPGTIMAGFSQTMVAGDCDGESIVTRTWTLTDACGNVRTHVQTIILSDNTGPTFVPPLPPSQSVSCENPVPAAPTLIAVDACDMGNMMNQVWINEIHYDNTGTDVNECIEIAGTAGVNLADYSIVLYNGTPTGMTAGMTYDTDVLSGIIPNLSNGFGAISFCYPANGIQNGNAAGTEPDGIALVHNVMGGMLVQFLSYEGSFVAVGGPANGVMSTNIGVFEDGAGAVGTSLQLTGNGDEYSDFTWAAPATATNNAVNNGQTFIAASVGPTVTFSETTTPGDCPQERTIVRTWTTGDNCGNPNVYTQTIEVVDNTAPTVTCPPTLTVPLSNTGVATLNQNDVSFTYSDNCSDVDDLVVLPASANYTCAQAGQTVPFIIQVRDECQNVGSCTIQVSIPDVARCAPVIINDPCMCLNNATNLVNGRFSETIKIESLSGKTWTIVSNDGLYQFPSGSALIADNFLENPAGSGDYYLTGFHVDAIGYQITVQSEIGEILQIGNRCEYPNPAITSDLDGPFCLFSDPVLLTGTPGDDDLFSEVFRVNGVIATEFDPAVVGVGVHTIEYTVDGGMPKAFGPDDPGCIQSVQKTVEVVATSSSLTCNNLSFFSLSDDDCTDEITADLILLGNYGCFDDYSVHLTNAIGNISYGNTVTAANIGQTLTVTVTHLPSGNSCWGQIKIEDKLPPVMSCADLLLPCNTPKLEPGYLESIGIPNAFPTVTDCQNYTLTYIDTEAAQNCASGLTKIITRKWTAVDASGNSATCTQTIRLFRTTLADLVPPPNYDDFGAPSFPCGSAYPTPEWIESQGLQGFPYFFTYPNGCDIEWTYNDVVIPVCDGTYKIRREWTIIDDCAGASLTYIQYVKVADKLGPTFACPANLTVSTEPYQCCAIVDLPDVVLNDNCSDINNLTGMLTVRDFYTNEIVNMLTLSGTIGATNSSGTAGIFGNTTCLPLGTHTVRYNAQDDCGNTNSCQYSLTVRDFVPPTANCVQFTTVSLGQDSPTDCYEPSADGCEGAGVAWLKASALNNNSFDNCNGLKFTVQRMAPYSDCIEGLSHDDCYGPNFSEYTLATLELDSLKFYCCEVGTSQMVIFRVYQTDLNGNLMVDGSGQLIVSSCMVEVEVQDKIRPTCVAPSDVTVSCEQFDPTLWPYGLPSKSDNCCLETPATMPGGGSATGLVKPWLPVPNECGLIEQRDYTLFDTTCHRGTITRRFRTYDCHGNSFTPCQQRIVVTYEQDYFVKFPADVIATSCDGAAPFGEPTFFGEDCELLATSYEDEIFTVVPDACFKIERTWSVINWCTYNPNVPCTYVPNPNPNPVSNHPDNLLGVTVSAPGTPAPWAPTVRAINPGVAPTNYSTYWSNPGTYGAGLPATGGNANCYEYKQIVKVIDTEDPILDDCPPSGEVCDLTVNEDYFWNEHYWWDEVTMQHDLCEGPVDLHVTAHDACTGPLVNYRYHLYLDLDNNGTMETVVNSLNPPPPGIVYFGNAANPNFEGGEARYFDNRNVPLNKLYRFSTLLQFTPTGQGKVACARWNTLEQPNVFNTPELPHGTHKIKWFVADGCGNESICEQVFTVRDCKPPTIYCHNVNVTVMPAPATPANPSGGMIAVWANDVLLSLDDNCTPDDKIRYGIRRAGAGTGFPFFPAGHPQAGQPQDSVIFTCDHVGAQFVELWAMDLDGNMDYCEATVNVQNNVGACESMGISVVGSLRTEVAVGVADAVVMLEGTHPAVPPFSANDMTDQNGTYSFANGIVPNAANITITPIKDDNPLNGVTTFDLVLISKHILGLEPLDSPYKMIGADANRSGSITSFDIVELRKLILGIYDELPNNTSWRFVDRAFVFPVPANPFQSAFPEEISRNDIQSNLIDANFVGCKIGDVNNSAITNNFQATDDRTAGTLIFDVEDREVSAGEEFALTFSAAAGALGWQFTLNHAGLKVLEIVENEHSKVENFGIFDGFLTTSSNGARAFTLRLRAEKAGRLSQMLGVSSRVTKAEAYALDGNRLSTALRFDGKTIAGIGFELYQNQPNPFVSKTSVGFHLPEATTATLTVRDESGRLVFTQKGDFAKGYNAVVLDRALLPAAGLLYYTLETATDSATRKMIQSK
jgi:hypothetical protein